MIWTGREETSWGFREGEEVAPGLVTIRKLGGGGEFEVYLANDDESQSEVVVKMVRPHLVDESHPVSGLRREAELLSRIEHPAIVRLIRSASKWSRPHLVSEFCKGPTLAEAIRADETFDVSDALSLATDVADALAYLHTGGVVHLDVKPGNIVLGQPHRLIDFGIARTIEDAAQLKSPAGTDAFMAPEQCDPARATVGPAADVWGLGATLHFALVGEPPFPRRDTGGRSGPVWRWPQMTGELHLPESLSGDVSDLLAALLASAPADRPSSNRLPALLREAKGAP